MMMRRVTAGMVLLVMTSWALRACSNDEASTEEAVQADSQDQGGGPRSEKAKKSKSKKSDRKGAGESGGDADETPGSLEDDAAEGGEASDGADFYEPPRPSDEAPPEGDVTAPAEPEAAAPAPAPDAPASAPVAPNPQPSGGGIISSGDHDSDWDRCKKVMKFDDRKRCFEKLLKKN
jgi:hypothetical protein